MLWVATLTVEHSSMKIVKIELFKNLALKARCHRIMMQVIMLLFYQGEEADNMMPANGSEQDRKKFGAV